MSAQGWARAELCRIAAEMQSWPGWMRQAAMAGVKSPLPPCDCRANDWVEGDCGAIRCEQCGGYSGEPGTSIRVVVAAVVKPEESKS